MPDTGQPHFDPEKAAALVGAYVIVGITYNDHNDKELSQEQFHGVVMEAHPERGITIGLKGVRAGETFTLPPDLDTFKKAGTGTYRFRTTGEEIVAPDFLTTWVMTEPHPENRPDPEQ